MTQAKVYVLYHNVEESEKTFPGFTCLSTSAPKCIGFFLESFPTPPQDVMEMGLVVFNKQTNTDQNLTSLVEVLRQKGI